MPQKKQQKMRATTGTEQFHESSPNQNQMVKKPEKLNSPYTQKNNKLKAHINKQFLIIIKRTRKILTDDKGYEKYTICKKIRQ